MLSRRFSLYLSSIPRCASARRQFCNASPVLEKAQPAPSTDLKFPLKITQFKDLDSRAPDLHPSIRQTAISIASVILAPGNPQVDMSYNLGAGVAVDPTLVLTSAQVVGRVSDGNAYVALTGGRDALEKSVKLSPLAVSFASNVAVLKVDPEGAPLASVCQVADSSPAEESDLTVVSHSEENNPEMAVFSSEQEVCEPVIKMSGSPLFNLSGEVVGLASWAMKDAMKDEDAAGSSEVNAVPVSNIWPVIDYAKTKGPEDPIVMDSGINEVVLSSDIEL